MTHTSIPLDILAIVITMAVVFNVYKAYRLTYLGEKYNLYYLVNWAIAPPLAILLPIMVTDNYLYLGDLLDVATMAIFMQVLFIWPAVRLRDYLWKE